MGLVLIVSMTATCAHKKGLCAGDPRTGEWLANCTASVVAKS